MPPRNLSMGISILKLTYHYLRYPLTPSLTTIVQMRSCLSGKEDFRTRFPIAVRKTNILAGVVVLRILDRGNLATVVMRRNTRRLRPGAVLRSPAEDNFVGRSPDAEGEAGRRNPAEEAGAVNSRNPGSVPDVLENGRMSDGSIRNLILDAASLRRPWR